MIELLTIDKVTIIGILLVACYYLVKSNNKALDNIAIQNKEERERLVSEYRSLKEEGKQERKEWLKALSDNTKQLNNIAEKLESIPNMQRDLDELKIKVDLISKK